MSLNIPNWAVMWGLSFAIYFACKVLSWSVRTAKAPSWKHAAYLVAWPGMNADTFLGVREPPAAAPPISEWAFAFFKLALGALIIWGVLPLLSGCDAWLVGWIGLAGIALILHFGLFHLLSCLWRRMGIAAAPIMNWPVLSHSVTEFWSRRWNVAFRELTHRFLFAPLSRRLGPPGALLTGFFASGLVHEVVISIPAGGGYGLPTCYFLLQGLAIVVERSRWGRQQKLGRGWRGRIFSWCAIVLPSPLLFHSPFINRVILPFLAAIGAV